MRRTRFGTLAVSALAFLLLGGCRGAGGSISLPAQSAAGIRANQASLEPFGAKGKIKHVVIIIQENRSFDNLFYGYPGAHTQSWGYDSNHKKIPLKPLSLVLGWDMQHNGQGFLAACDGSGKLRGTDCRMDGFDKLKCNPKHTDCPNRSDLAYSYAPHNETKPYFDIAHQYVLADEMYASDFDISSFESHQYIIAGVNPEKSVDYPIGAAWGCPGGPTDKIAVLFKNRTWLNDQHRPKKEEPVCWDVNTLADELDAKKLSWAFYANPLNGSGYSCGGGSGIVPDGSSGGGGIWSAYQAIKHICYGADWNANIVPFSPSSKFLTDVKSGELRAVTWITPTCKDSDHAGCNYGAPPTSGPSWVASVVNAVGESKFWDSTAIFVFWDDSGGWYDHAPPNYEDNDGLGFRLPLLIISPYAKNGYVDHTPYEHGTILKFIENQFGLPPLEDPNDKKASDIRANAPKEAFDFSQPPRKFVPIKAPLDENYFLHERPDGQPADDD